MTLELLKPITTWLHAHPALAVVFAGIVAFLESLAIIGTIVPGSVTLTAVGVLMGAGVIAIYPALISAIIGAVLGDSVSFWFGRHYHQRLRSMWPLRHYPQLLARGETYFKKHGGKSIFFGRFVGPIRSILPLVAGMLDMPVMHFLLADIVSAIFWAPSYMLPGIVLGAATLELPPRVASQLLLYALAIIAGVWLLFYLLKKTLMLISTHIDQWLAACWRYCHQHPRWQFLPRALHHAADIRAHRQLVFLLLLPLSFLLFAVILLNPGLQGSNFSVNTAVFHLMQSSRTLLLDNILMALTFLGEKRILAMVTVAIAGILLWQRQRRAAVFIVSNFAFTAASVWLFKHWAAVVRPEHFSVVKPTFSMPSGHASAVTACFGFMAWLYSRESSDEFTARIASLTISIIITVCLSRVYFGHHWLTDVIAGIALGGFWVSVHALLYPLRPIQRIMTRRNCLLFCSCLVIAWVGYGALHWQRDMSSRQLQFTVTHSSTNQWWDQQQPMLGQYRYDRLGKPSSPLNIQWLGNVKTIVASLEQAGWQLAPKYDAAEWLRRITAADKAQALPAMPALYHYRRATVIMIKGNQQQPLLVLRLWPSSHRLSDNTEPLWVGQLNYRLLWQHRWLDQHQAMVENLSDPMPMLMADLSQWQTRTISYHLSIHEGTQVISGPQRILLIKSKS